MLPVAAVRFRGVLVPLLFAVACGNESESALGEAEPQIRWAGPAVPAGPSDFPQHSCVDSVVREMVLRETAAIVPEDLRRKPQPQDRGWAPTRLVDVVPTSGGFAVLDQGAGELVLFSPDFKRRRTVARRGGGPAELEAPASLAADPAGDTIWVLNGRPPRITGFTREGTFVRNVPLQESASALSVGSGPDFLLGHVLIHDRLRTDGSTPMPLVSSVSALGDNAGVVVGVRHADLRPPRYVLPGFTEVLLRRSGPYSFVLFPAAGVVDVLRGRETVATLQTCMPAPLLKAYRAQQDQAGPSGQQVALNLITDVVFDGGWFYVVGATRDVAGRFHIDRFTVDGTPAGSIVLPAPYLRLLSVVRFVGSPWKLVTLDGNGLVATIAVVDSI